MLREVLVDLLSYESPQLPDSKSARTLSYRKPRASSPSLRGKGAGHRLTSDMTCGCEVFTCQAYAMAHVANPPQIQVRVLGREGI